MLKSYKKRSITEAKQKTHWIRLSVTGKLNGAIVFLGWLRWWRICLQCNRCGFDLWVGRSPGEGNGYQLQNSCLENSMERGVWQVTVHGTAKSWTGLSDFHFSLGRRGSSLSILNYFNFNFYWSICLCNIVLVSAIWQSESVIHTHVPTLFLRFFPHVGHTEYWVEFPVQYNKYLLVIYFTYNSM